MARPPLPIGTYGKIRTGRNSAGGFTARTAFRDYDGVTRDVERNGQTKGAAENALKEVLRDRARVVGTDEVKPDSKVSELVDVWWPEWQRSVDHSPNTAYNYRRALDRLILPGLGALRLREVNAGRVTRFLREVEDHNGGPTAKMARSVMSGMFGYATRQNALSHNPVRDAGRISVAKPPATALSIPQVRQLLAFMTYDRQAIARDLLDFVAFLAATGVRHGEALGVRWCDVDFATGTVAIRHQVIRVVGSGLVLKAPKSGAGVRVLELPRWALRMLELRRMTALVADRLPKVAVLRGDGKLVDEQLTTETAMVFPSTRTGAYGPRDPRNVHRQVADAYAFAGMDITNHKFRKTVLTEMDMAGLSARAAADQAGHSQVSMTQNVYFGRKVAKTGAAEILEAIGEGL